MRQSDDDAGTRNVLCLKKIRHVSATSAKRLHIGNALVTLRNLST